MYINFYVNVPHPTLKFGGETSRGRHVQLGQNVLGAKRLGEEMDLGRNRQKIVIFFPLSKSEEFTGDMSRYR